MEFLISAMWVGLGVAAAYFAKQRGRNAIAWFLIGMFFGIFGLITLFLMPALAPAGAGAKIKSSETHSQPVIEALPPPQPIDNREWFYADKDYVTQGPVSFDAIKALHDNGTLPDDTLVWCEGMEGWKEIKAICNDKC